MNISHSVVTIQFQRRDLCRGFPWRQEQPLASLCELLQSALVNQFCLRPTGPQGTSASELVPVVEYTQKYLFNIPFPLGIFQLSPQCLVMRKWFIISFICCCFLTRYCAGRWLSQSSSVALNVKVVISVLLLETLYFNCSALTAFNILGLCLISSANEA